MAHFEGKWKLDRHDNFDGFLKAIGTGPAKALIARNLKPEITIKLTASGFEWKNKSIVAQEAEYVWGEEKEDKAPDGQMGKQVWVMEGDNMVGTFTMASGKTIKITRTVENGEIKQHGVTSCGVECTQCCQHKP